MTDEMTARALRSSWRASEQALYSIGGGDVERYQRAVRLVRAVVDDLRETESTVALVDRWPDAGRIVADAAERAGLALGSLPVDQVAGAAFALRQTVLQADESRRARSELIAAARAGAADWVVLHETGDPLAGFADPYGSTRMHLPSGLAIVAAVQPDLATGAPVHTLTVVRLDPRTGDLLDDDPGVADDLAYSDSSSFRTGEAALREVVEEAATAGRI
jgi:MoxR-like ATPase